jgi:hypothetical protein
VLSLGGQFYRERDGAKWFAAPYVYSVGTALPSPNVPRKGVSFDPFQYGVVIGQGVRVRQEPRASSPIVTTLSFDVVRVTDWAPASDADGVTRRWIAVRLEDGTSGYVAADYILHRAGYRAGFERRAGRWVLRWLIAGD